MAYADEIVKTNVNIEFIFTYGAIEEYSDIVLWWRCEGVAFNTTLDYGNSATVSYIAPYPISVLSYRIGTHSLSINDGSEGYSASINNVNMSGTSGRIGFWYNSLITSGSDNILSISGSIFIARSGSSMYVGETSFAHTISSSLMNGAIASFASGTWYFLELVYSSTEFKLLCDGATLASYSGAIDPSWFTSFASGSLTFGVVPS